MSPVRNKVLSLTRNVIPYVKELRVFTDSVVGCILMQQLDYWFGRYPNGFYKFLEPSEHPKYLSGQSWSEEIGISIGEFRTAFDRIGTRWKSKTEFDNAPDKFLGKFYASYQDKRANLTFYYRNHELVDSALDELLDHLTMRGVKGGGGEVSQGVKMSVIIDSKARVDHQFTGDEETPSPVNRKSESLVDEQQPSTGSGLTVSPELQKQDLQEMANLSLNNTDTTITDITQKLLLRPASNAGLADERLIFPRGMIQEEIEALAKLVAELDYKTAQQILDEVSGLRKVGRIKSSSVGLAMELKRRCQAGTFLPSVGFRIAAEREQVANSLRETQPKITSGPRSKKLLTERLHEAGVYLHRC